MFQVDERFHLVNLDYLQKEIEESNDMEGSSMLKVLITTAIQEIQMHRKFNKDYSDYLRFINEARNA